MEPKRPGSPTKAQLRVMEAYVRLGSQKAVAHELGIRVQTVKNHMGDLYVRLGVGDHMEALHRLGWVCARVPSDSCGWLAYCSRPSDHGGHHGGFRPVLQEP